LGEIPEAIVQVEASTIFLVGLLLVVKFNPAEITCVTSGMDPASVLALRRNA